MPANRRIKTSIALPDGSKIVLYAWGTDTSPRLRNVERLASDGRAMWQAELPASEKADCFVAMRREAGRVTVKTYSGAKYALDVETGSRVAPVS